MAASPPASERRRPRPGSLERPVSGRMYRGTWLLVGLPLLVVAFTVSPPEPLPPPPLPPVFDGTVARELAGDLARSHPDRFPGSPGARDAAAWFRSQLEPYGFRIQSDRFDAEIPGHGRVRLENLVAVSPGRSSRALVVIAHRDNAGTGPGANDNASGTAALVELASSYARQTAGTTGSVAGPTQTIVFLSTDGGAFGALGAARFAERSPYRDRIVAALNLTAIAGEGRVRLEVAGDRSRSPAASLVRTAAARVLEQTGAEIRRPSAVAQLIDLAFPFSLYEQAPFVARGVPAITLTTADSRPPPSSSDTPERLNAERLTEVGRSAQSILGSLDQGLELSPGPSSYLFLGSRFVRGWAIQLALAAGLLPFLLAAVDLFARCRRRRIPLAPALRAYRSRLAFWLFAGLLFGVFVLLGVWADGAPRPLSPESSAATRWGALGLALLAVLGFLGWLVARDRLIPRRPVTAEEELAGHTAALLALSAIALLVIATNAFALIFLLPSLHAWLWLPQLRDRPAWVRGVAVSAGLAGPLLLVGSFAYRFELGLDAPWYLVQLAAVGYVEPASLLIVCAWLAAAAQLVALAGGRYAPYPSARDRPPGPVRALGRAAVAVVRGRARAAQERKQAAVG